MSKDSPFDFDPVLPANDYSQKIIEIIEYKLKIALRIHAPRKVDIHLIREALLEALPDEMEFDKFKPTWRQIWSAAETYRLRSMEEQNEDMADAYRKAADTLKDICQWQSTMKMTHEVDWDFCPFCWRPVPKSHLKRPARCRDHQSRSKGYSQVCRVLAKEGYKFKKGTKDRMPFGLRIEIRTRLRNLWEKAFIDPPDNMIPFWLSCLPLTKAYLEEKQTDPMDYDACVKVLADSEEISLVMTQEEVEAMFIRAETWLTLMSKKGVRGGRRKGAGRPKKEISNSGNEKG